MKSDCHGAEVSLKWLPNYKRHIVLHPDKTITLHQTYMECGECHKPCAPVEEMFQVTVNDEVTEGEIWFCYGPKIVGKIVNIWEKKDE